MFQLLFHPDAILEDPASITIEPSSDHVDIGVTQYTIQCLFYSGMRKVIGNDNCISGSRRGSRWWRSSRVGGGELQWRYQERTVVSNLQLSLIVHRITVYSVPATDILEHISTIEHSQIEQLPIS